VIAVSTRSLTITSTSTPWKPTSVNFVASTWPGRLGQGPRPAPRLGGDRGDCRGDACEPSRGRPCKPGYAAWLACNDHLQACFYPRASVGQARPGTHASCARAEPEPRTKRLECPVSKLVSSDTCPRPTTTFTKGASASLASRRAISVLPQPVGPIIRMFLGVTWGRRQGVRLGSDTAPGSQLLGIR
jgi:hypothetical protein